MSTTIRQRRDLARVLSDHERDIDRLRKTLARIGSQDDTDYLPLASWPVGSVFIAAVDTSPATLLGGGTWERFGEGRVLVSQSGSDPDFDTAEETGGAKTVTLTEAQMPSHTHLQNPHTHTQNPHTHTQNAHQHHSATRTTDAGTLASGTGISPHNGTPTGPVEQALPSSSVAATNQNATATNQNATATNQSAGGGQAHNNLQPYIVVYMWKRTA